MDSRRDFIKKALLLTGALSLPNVIPMSIQKAMAINADPGTTFYDAEHVVFLMQENRSFDHMFGKLKGVRGFNDPRPHTLPNNHKVWLQDDDKGNTYAPFHIDLNHTKVTWQGGLPHSWKDQTAARNHGKHDRWVPVKSLMTMAHYQRADIPFYYALADAFTTCDQSFCSSLTGTTPNRLFFWTGTNRPTPDGDNVAVVNNSQAESQDNTFVDWPTFPELLEDNGIDWRVYQNEIWTAQLPAGETDDWLGNYGDNPLEYVKRHNVKLASYFRKNGDKTVKPALSAAEVQAKYDALSQREKNLIDKAFTTNSAAPDYLDLAPFTYTNENGKQETINIPKGDIFYQFRKDVNEGKLPTVSWLVAPQRFSDHTSSPLYGTWYVSEALDILTKNPEVWKKTIFILTYDENDGYFDHIPPFVAPKPNSHASGKVSSAIDTAADYERNAGSPIGLGYRIPMIVASPWSKGGYVNSQVFDHTSSLMFLEKFLSKKTGKEIKSKQISSWRRAICGDLTSAFREYKNEILTPVKPLQKTQVISHIQQVKNKPEQHTPPALSAAEIAKINQYHPFQKNSSALMPQQEKGIRPACALPYELFVDAELNETKTSVLLNFSSGKSSAGAAFNVNALNTYGKNKGRTWAYAVVSGDEITDNWELESFEDAKYDLSIQGPNGFFRRFAGNKNDPELWLKCIYGRNRLMYKLSGELQLAMKNNGKEVLEVMIKDESYGNPPEILKVSPKGIANMSVNIKKTKGWYDFTVRIKGKNDFVRRYSGHVENSMESTTDPLMGGIL